MEVPDWPPITLDRLLLKRTTILEIAHSHGADNVRVFGSVVKGTADLLSDVDIAVDLEPGRSPLDIERLAAALEDALGWPVDLLVTTYQDDHQRVSAYLRDAVPL